MTDVGATRRELLACAGGAAALSAGCVSRTRALVNRDSAEQVALSVKTLPADADLLATTIARRLVEHLEAVGVAPKLVPMEESELLRDVLVNGNFDVYVTRLPRPKDPDRLRPLFHSQYAEEPGWQNPFGFADLRVDGLLETQRDAESRRSTVGDLQEALAQAQPLTPLVAADEVRAVRADRFERASAGFEDPQDYLTAHIESGDGPGTLRVTRTDARATRNLNPLSVEFRNRGTITGLLYDSLGRRADGAVRPWLAADWRWEREGSPTATVELREGLTWHDGTSIDAEDVAFTYRFLEDTSLSESERAVPAPRFRGRTALVEETEMVDDTTIRLSFGSVAREVASRTLTVPVLPGHVWRERTGAANLTGLSLYDGTTEALVWPNPDPVGSGPLRVENRVPGERLVLERVDDHFAAVPYEKLVVDVVPSALGSLDLLSAGDADVTGSALPPSAVAEAAREDALRVTARPARMLYHLGFNTTRPRTSNTRFRRAVAGLLDESYLVRSVFRGYATPATTPLAGSDWVPSSLAWDGADPEVPFFGRDGDLDVDAARNAFRDIGFEYDDGSLMAR